MDFGRLLSPRTLVVALVGALVLTVVFVGSTSTAAFGVYNPSWDGASGVQSVVGETSAESRVVMDTNAYAGVEANATVAFVVSPTEAYDDAAISRLRDFVRAGGTLIVAEDFGAEGNEILHGVGAQTRFDGRLVRDPRNHGPTTAMPTVEVTNSSRLSGTDAVMLNHGTVLEPENATVLAETSEFAYIDRDGDGEMDGNESFRTYPVAAGESVGEGRVVAVSDASVFINAMRDRSSNEAFIRALVDGQETVLLDYSHASTAPPLQVALVWLRSTPLAQSGMGLGSLAVVFLWHRRRS